MMGSHSLMMGSHSEGLSLKTCFLMNLPVFHLLQVKSSLLNFSHWVGNAVLDSTLEEQVFSQGLLQTSGSGLSSVKWYAQWASAPERGDFCKGLVRSSPRCSLGTGGCHLFP